MLKRLFTVALLAGPLALVPTAASAAESGKAGGYETLDHGQEPAAEDDHDHDGDGKPDHDAEDHDETGDKDDKDDKDEKPAPKPKDG